MSRRDWPNRSTIAFFRKAAFMVASCTIKAWAVAPRFVTIQKICCAEFIAIETSKPNRAGASIAHIGQAQSGRASAGRAFSKRHQELRSNDVLGTNAAEAAR
jgi:hypothetical protein